MSRIRTRAAVAALAALSTIALAAPANAATGDNRATFGTVTTLTPSAIGVQGDNSWSVGYGTPVQFDGGTISYVAGGMAQMIRGRSIVGIYTHSSCSMFGGCHLVVDHLHITRQ